MPRITGLSAILLCLALAACDGDIKETLGLNRHGPDAFQVYERPPLTIPPEFSLAPPGNGPEHPAGTPADVQAHNEMLGAGAPAAVAGSPVTPVPAASSASPFSNVAPTPVPAVTANALPTSADSQFLSDIGAGKSDPQIREEIQKDQDNGVKPKGSNQYLINTAPSTDPLVDPTKEAARLKQDKAQGQPPTTGDTPVIAPQDKGLLGGIF